LSRGKGGGHFGRTGHYFRKVFYRAVIEKFPDLVSGVSEDRKLLTGYAHAMTDAFYEKQKETAGSFATL
jgi:hypothetical protein